MTQDQPDRLDNLEAALGRFAEMTIQNVRRHDEAIIRHDEVLSRLEENVAKHDENLFRIEGAIVDLTTRMDRTERNIEALRTTAAETLQLVAEQALITRPTSSRD